jgi:hypothetical protein
VRGRLATRSAADAFTHAEGLAVRIRDFGFLDEIVEWLPAECATLANGRLRCRKSAGPRVEAVLRPIVGAPPGRTTYAVRVRMDGLSLQGPLDEGVVVVLADRPGELVRGIDRFGTVASCRARVDGEICRRSS